MEYTKVKISGLLYEWLLKTLLILTISLNLSCRPNEFLPKDNPIPVVPPPTFTNGPDTSKGSRSEVMIDTGFTIDMERGKKGNLYIRASFLRKADYERNNKMFSNDAITLQNTPLRPNRTIRGRRNASSQCLKPEGVKFYHDKDRLGSLHCEEYSKAVKAIGGSSSEQPDDRDYALGVNLFITIKPNEQEFRKKSKHFDYYRWLQVVYTNAGTSPDGREIAEQDLGKKQSYLDPHNDCHHIFSRSDLKSLGPFKAIEDDSKPDDLKLYFKCNENGHITIRKADQTILKDYCIVPFYGLGESTGEIDPDADFSDKPYRYLSDVDQMRKRLFWDGVVALYGVKRKYGFLEITRLRMLNYGFDIEYSENSPQKRLQESVVMAMLTYQNHKKEWDRFNAGLRNFLSFFKDPKYKGYLCESIVPVN